MGGKPGFAGRGCAIGTAALLAGCIPQGIAPYPYRPQNGPSAPATVQSLPTTPPAWETRPVSADAATVAGSTYTVRSGDTLREIAIRTGAGSEAIARANGLAPPFTIYPGQKLTVPGGRYHLVRKGDTGIAIAQAYGVPWSDIVAVNAFAPPYILRVGQRLLIPGNASAADTRPSRRRYAKLDLDVDDILTGGEPAIAANEKPVEATTSSARVLPPTAAVQPPARLAGNFGWPVDGTLLKSFGPGKSGERNDGITIGVPMRTPIRAAADGVVAYVGDDVPALGGIVLLKHGDNFTTVYGHASQLLVQRGQAVKRGQTIALSGQSGSADRPEVHFEIRKGRTPVDPLGKLPSR